jgi:hypothetical protein
MISPRISVTIGIILQLPFYFLLFDSVRTMKAPIHEDTAYATLLTCLFSSGALVGFGQALTTYAAKRYVY